MSTKIVLVPKRFRVVIGFLALLNIFFGVMGFFDMAVLFEDGAGLDLTNAILKNASYDFAARNLAIGLGLAIVSFKGVPEIIALKQDPTMKVLGSMIGFQSIRMEFFTKKI